LSTPSKVISYHAKIPAHFMASYIVNTHTWAQQGTYCT